MLTQVLILSELQARDIVDFPEHAVISIISPGYEHPQLTAKQLLQVHFHDVDQMLELQDGRIIMPISQSIADEIAAFIAQHRDEPRWVIHCEEGISRSPGVGLAIAGWHENHNLVERLEVNFPLYNRFVLRQVENALLKMSCIEQKIEPIKMMYDPHDSGQKIPGCRHEDAPWSFTNVRKV